MLITFEGHACFTLEANGVQVMIDPYITGNSVCKKSAADFNPDVILVTHGHHDHVGDAVEIARNSGAILAAQVELINALDTEGIETVAFQIGGTTHIKGLDIIMTPAWHGNSVNTKDGIKSAGLACGYIVKDGKHTVYHAGDTALFGDMSMVLSRYNIDCSLLPIGDFYTMGPKDAVTAAHWLKTKSVIPMHYNTSPKVEQDVDAFAMDLEDRTDCKCIVLAAGEEYELL